MRCPGIRCPKTTTPWLLLCILALCVSCSHRAVPVDEGITGDAAVIHEGPPSGPTHPDSGAFPGPSTFDSGAHPGPTYVDQGAQPGSTTNDMGGPKPCGVCAKGTVCVVFRNEDCMVKFACSNVSPACDGITCSHACELQLCGGVNYQCHTPNHCAPIPGAFGCY